MTDSRRPRPRAYLNVHHQELAQVNIRKLKEFALNNIPKDNPLQQIILSEKNLLDPPEFLAKVDVWLKLSRLLINDTPFSLRYGRFERQFKMAEEQEQRETGQ